MKLLTMHDVLRVKAWRIGMIDDDCMLNNLIQRAWLFMCFGVLQWLCMFCFFHIDFVARSKRITLDAVKNI